MTRMMYIISFKTTRLSEHSTSQRSSANVNTNNVNELRNATVQDEQTRNALILFQNEYDKKVIEFSRGEKGALEIRKQDNLLLPMENSYSSISQY